MKKWNWHAFTFIIVIGCLGALTNKNVNDIYEFIVIALIICVPIGLLVAYISKED